MHHVQAVRDPPTVAIVGALVRRARAVSNFSTTASDAWHPVHSEQINAHLKGLIGRFTAKNFRTWNATVLAAVLLAAQGRHAASQAARRRAINAATAAVSEVLQHAGSRAAFVYRPARLRSLPVGVDDRRGAGPDRSPAGVGRTRAGPNSSLPSSTYCTTTADRPRW